MLEANASLTWRDVQGILATPTLTLALTLALALALALTRTRTLTRYPRDDLAKDRSL